MPQKAGSKRRSGGLIRSVRVLPVLLGVAAVVLVLKAQDVYTGVQTVGAGLPISAAQAQSPAPRPATAPVAAPARPADVAAAPTFEMPRDVSQLSQSEVDLLQALAQRRDLIERRERDITQREMLLQVAERRLEQKASELEQARAELQGLLNRSSEAEDGRLRSLVRIYEQMKPREAAQIFDQLDLAVLIGVVERMKETKVAPILASMQPERAKVVTAMLADRGEVPAQPAAPATPPRR
jgi:flagellar motility protein MotE (MotC chaperone)